MSGPLAKGYNGGVRGTRILFAAALGASALVLAACGNVKQVVDPVASAATKTDQAGGVKMELTLHGTAAGQSFDATGNGVFADDQGSMQMTMSGLGDMTIDYLTENGDPVVYMKMPALSSRLPGGKPWIRLDLQQLGKSIGVDMSGAASGATQNPAEALKLLEQNGTFTKVGTDTIGGVSTTHYHGTIDLKKAVQASSVSDQVKHLVESGAPNDFPIDVWIDDSGYLRQIEESFGAKGASTDMTLDLSDYGAHVNVTAPPADQVFDATSLASQGLGSLGGTTTTGP
jgi:hypothetical protein